MHAPHVDPLNRRRATAALVALPWLWTGARAQPAVRHRLTPAQTEGPFYPVALPADIDADLLRNGARPYAQGTPARVLLFCPFHNSELHGATVCGPRQPRLKNRQPRPPSTLSSMSYS